MENPEPLWQWNGQHWVREVRPRAIRTMSTPWVLPGFPHLLGDHTLRAGKARPLAAGITTKENSLALDRQEARWEALERNVVAPRTATKPARTAHLHRQHPHKLCVTVRKTRANPALNQPNGAKLAKADGGAGTQHSTPDLERQRIEADSFLLFFGCRPRGSQPSERIGL